MNRIFLKNCLALIGQHAVASNGPVDIAIEGNRIAAVTPAGQRSADGEVIDATGRLATAGLINSHFHSGENYLKGRYENLPVEMFMMFVRPPKPIPLTPRQIYLRTMIGAIEGLRSGTTTLIDDLNQDLPDSHLSAVYKAYEDIGIRALVSSSMVDRHFFESIPYVDEEFETDVLEVLRSVPIASGPDLLRRCRELALARHPRSHRVGYIVAPSAPQRCSEEFLRSACAIAQELELPVITHVQESRLQVVHGRQLYGSTMVEYLYRIGFLGPNTSLIHCVWLNPREIDLLAKTGTTVQHNPWSNLKLGSGLAPMRALLDAGVNVSLGCDGCACSDSLNMLTVVSSAATLGKLRENAPSRWITAKEAWYAGTMGGAIAIGRGNDLGAIEAGRIADLVLYRLSSIPFVPLNNPLQQLVYAERGVSIDMVLVDGQIVFRDGKLTCVDEPAILAEIAEEHAKLLPFITEAEKMSARMLHAAERIHRRCLSEEIAPDTYPARFPR